MQKNDKTYNFEFFTTFALLFLLIFIFKGSLGQAQRYIIYGLSLGMPASWFILRKPQFLMKIFANTMTLGIPAWTIYKIINSSFFYKDVVLLCVKSTFFLIMVFSFSARLPKFLNYMQVLSLLLFLEASAMLKDYNAENLVPLGAYLLGSLILLKSKFHANFKAHQDTKPADYSLPFTVFILISAITACVLFLLIPLKQINSTGIFLDELRDDEVQYNEEEMFILQDKIQEELTQAVFKLAETEQRYKALNSLGRLIQDSPDVRSAVNAEENLLSIINNPDSGLNRSSRQELSVLIDKYTAKKIPQQMERIKENLNGTLQNAGLNLGKRFRILQKINKIQQSNSSEELNNNSRQLQKNFDKSVISAGAKKQLKEDTAKLREWKLYQLYRKRLAAITKKINIYTGDKKGEITRLISEINAMEKKTHAQTIDNKISGLKENALPLEKNIILGIEELLNLKSDITAIKERKEIQEKLRDTGIPQAMLSDPENGSEELEGLIKSKSGQNIKNAPAVKKTPLQKDKLLDLLVHSLITLFLLPIASLLLLSFLTEKERKRIAALRSNRKEFIIALYGNLVRILEISGLKHYNYTPHLSYAAAATERYTIPGGLFRDFTEKFEKAKYSKQAPADGEDAAAISDYKAILRILFSRHDKRARLFLYLKSLIKKVPITILA